MRNLDMNANEIKEFLETEITDFLSQFNTIFYELSSKLYNAFEAYCIDLIVKFYQNRKCQVKVKNLINGKFRYKFTTGGFLPNYSYFSVHTPDGNEFEIRHNAQVRPSKIWDYKYTVDIVIIPKNSLIENTKPQVNKNDKYFIYNRKVKTFMEVKFKKPQPMACASFIGIVKEIKPNLLRINRHQKANYKAKHPAPSIIFPLKENVFIRDLKEDYNRKGYHINILTNVLYKQTNVYRASINRVK